jgi:hypothetical protein
MRQPLTTLPDAGHAQAIDPYRACTLCRHAIGDLFEGRHCVNEHVGSTRKPVLIERARAHGGACGPEAEHLDFPGLKP